MELNRHRNSLPITLLVGVVALVAIVGMALALASISVSAADTPTDYDTDDDGLIEVANLAQLNAIRWDLDGNGEPATSDATDYAAAFPNPLTATATVTAMGCPTGDHDGDSNTPERTGCAGYELTAGLDFDENGDGNRETTPTTQGSGWSPIGNEPPTSSTQPSRATATKSPTCTSARRSIPITSGCSATRVPPRSSATWA